MAESTGPASPDDPGVNDWNSLSKRVTDYFNSSEGRRNFFEGFSRSDTLKLFGIAERESQAQSRRYSFAAEQSGLPEGGTPGQALNARGRDVRYAKCRVVGHDWVQDWEVSDKAVVVFACSRCSVVRQSGALGWDKQAAGDIDSVDPEDMEPTDEELHLLCLWCGLACATVEARLDHEETCAP